MPEKKSAPAYDRILRRPEVIQRTGLKTTSIYERMGKGTFPRSIPLGGRTVGWSEAEINVWLEGLKACRDRAA